MNVLYLIQNSIRYLHKRGVGLDRLYIVLLIFFGLHITLNAQPIPDLIFVQIPDQQKIDYSAEDILKIKSDRYVAKARIVTLPSDSSNPINLTPDFYAACDPDVSFDGKSIIFSGKKTEVDHWQIWIMQSDGSEKRQLAEILGDCITPVYAGDRFYLNDEKPTPQIIFAGNVHGWGNRHEAESIYSIYGMDIEGGSVNRLSYNLSSDFSPAILPNGRIVFNSWQHYGGNEKNLGKFAFMAINNDGTDITAYYGNHEQPSYKDMIHISKYDQRIYFIESEALHWLGGGNLSFILKSRPLGSYKKLSSSVGTIYHSPCSLPDGELLVSMRSVSEKSLYELYRIDSETGDTIEKIYGESGWHSIDAHLLKAHHKVKGRSNWLIPGSESGVFYCLNSYQTDLKGHRRIERGMIKFLRIIEGIPRKTDTDNNEDLNKQNKSISQLARSGDSTVLGTIPVEKDGSFQVRVPAMTPLRFQLLDKDKNVLKSQRAWTWVMGNENRGCIGCHENRELSPPNIIVDAVTKPPHELINNNSKK
jgi:hypothetical protein